MGILTRCSGPLAVLAAAVVRLIVLIAMIPPRPALARDAGAFSLAGQVSLQSSVRFDAAFAPFFALRGMPKLEFTTARTSSAPGRLAIDAEVSVNAYGSAVLHGDAPAGLDGNIKPYRAWLRLSTSRFEARVGLQQVNFGSAILFRPMMWFDSLDPRDPLQLTDGVYALLVRYYTRGNANAWAWVMAGNGTRRGFDLAPPDKRTPEFGGRVQVPLFKGEIAATYHHRKAAIDGLTPVMGPFAPDASPLPVAPVPEDRFGLDGKWDLGVGLWFEGAVVRQRTPLLPLPFQLSLTAGLDYTFGLGRGLYALAEHFRLEASTAAFAAGQARSVSALLLRAPLGLSDELTAILYYDWQGDGLYKFLAWKRASDTVSFSVVAFWNPTTVLLYPGRPGSSSFAGTGLQLVLAYDF
jgi:hypothetical protein